LLPKARTLERESGQIQALDRRTRIPNKYYIYYHLILALFVN